MNYYGGSSGRWRLTPPVAAITPGQASFCWGMRWLILELGIKRVRSTREAGMSPVTADGGVVELTRDEGREMLDERTRRLLGMPLEEFQRRYETGTLDLGNPDAFSLVMQLPFAR